MIPTFQHRQTYKLWAGIDALKTYPGDAYVDYISLDMYEDSMWTSGTPQQRWQKMLDGDGRGLTFWADFAVQHGKPLGFDEWATNIDDGTFIENAYSWMKAHNVHPKNAETYKRLFNQ